MIVRTRAEPTLEALLKQAEKRGLARIKRKDGRTFVILPERGKKSPLEVDGVNLGLTKAEIAQFIQEGRRIAK